MREISWQLRFENPPRADLRTTLEAVT